MKLKMDIAGQDNSPGMQKKSAGSSEHTNGDGNPSNNEIAN